MRGIQPLHRETPIGRKDRNNLGRSISTVPCPCKHAADPVAGAEGWPLPKGLRSDEIPAGRHVIRTCGLLTVFWGGANGFHPAGFQKERHRQVVR